MGSNDDAKPSVAHNPRFLRDARIRETHDVADFPPAIPSITVSDHPRRLAGLGTV
jgi:hypothetical protein